MPMPTTRYERYQWRQARYKRRRRRKWKHYYATDAQKALRRHKHEPWIFFEGGLQRGPEVSSEGKSFAPLLWAQLHPAGWAFQPAAYRVPPVVKVLDASGHPVNWPDTHNTTAVIGYHTRRVKWIGKKIAKMRGRQRAIWLASVWAKGYGWFPAWDPLGRHPSSESEGGQIGYVTGDAWKPPFPIPE